MDSFTNKIGGEMKYYFLALVIMAIILFYALYHFFVLADDTLNNSQPQISDTQEQILIESIQ